MIEFLGDSVKLHKFPMSLTTNHLYLPMHGRLIKSSKGRQYSNDCIFWGAQNSGKLHRLKEILRGKTLRVDCDFVFPRSKLITKKNTLKKVDWGNRLKTCHDELAKLIGVDDSHFISGYCQKLVGNTDEAYVDITISIQDLVWTNKPK